MSCKHDSDQNCPLPRRVEIFFIDTSPFIQRYYKNSGEDDISWRLCPGEASSDCELVA